MNSPWIKEASEACSSLRCCLNPLPSLPKSLDRSNNSATFQYDFATATSSSLYPQTQFNNHEALPKLPEAFRSFAKAFPQYLQTVEADQIRAQEYHHLSHSKHVCLDYIGHGLFSHDQHQWPEIAASIASTSTNPPPSKHLNFKISYKSATLNSQIGDDVEESDFERKLRRRIMGFLNISEDEYFMVFTANQPSAFTLAAESYPFQNNRDLLTVYDHENEAVEAMIENSKRRGARALSAEFKWPKLRICNGKLRQMIVGKKKSNRGLFVFPLQSRVSGARYSYQWMSMAQENGWHVLLDASALGPKDMDTLGLSIFRPDFLICTCYKVFGEDPSGFGCLFIKKSHASMLNSLDISSSRGIARLIPSKESAAGTYTEQPSKLELQNGGLAGSSSFSEAFHRTGGGSSNFDEIEQSKNRVESSSSDHIETRNGWRSEIEFKGLDHADSLGMILINNRLRYLTNWLVNALLILKHPHSENGDQLITIYGPRIRFDRAPALAFNVFDWKGEKVDPVLVQKLADRHGISLGCGFIKNIWFSDRHAEKKKMLERETDRGEGTPGSKRRDGSDGGIFVVAANLGFLTNFEDVYRVWAFVSRFLDADFVEKERWRYAALNQKTIELI
ncbi:hypothetical protein Nepgr_030724 [Nepenthes gracilis]|uniref:Molybdenum cofactor sulfurase n=1 Tax=Nepenthes gracilis TaxID=150966 RepID=A0AAD3TH53_NEPGR|nr:hypothetical protein Nepgr_030724 [Nepenthes gracilis]